MRAVCTAWLLVAAASASPAGASAIGNPASDEPAIQKLIADYGKAIENKDVSLFKTVKPNLSQEEEKRARAAFEAVKSQVVKITVVSMEVEGDVAVVRVSRRDTINGSLVSSFPQTFRLARGSGGWGIVEIGK